MNQTPDLRQFGDPETPKLRDSQIPLRKDLHETPKSFTVTFRQSFPRGTYSLLQGRKEKRIKLSRVSTDLDTGSELMLILEDSKNIVAFHLERGLMQAR